MLIKAKDDPAQEIAQLESLLNRRDLPPNVRQQVKEELARLRQGWRGEKDVAYFLNFEFQNDPYWALIHDLRLEVGERTAQIDHLLLNAWMEIYVLESKSFRAGLKITSNNQFLFWDERLRKYRPIPSPVAQAMRHRVVLQDLFAQEIQPRWPRPLPTPSYSSLVLVSPHSRLIIDENASQDIRQRVYLADQFAMLMRRYTKTVLEKKRTRVLTSDELRKLAETLVQYHRPKRRNYWARFHISSRAKSAKIRETSPKYSGKSAKSKVTPASKAAQAGDTPRSASKSVYFCARCKKPISRKVALFCFQHKERFGGRAYCMDCQKAFPPK